MFAFWKIIFTATLATWNFDNREFKNIAVPLFIFLSVDHSVCSLPFFLCIPHLSGEPPQCLCHFNFYIFSSKFLTFSYLSLQRGRCEQVQSVASCAIGSQIWSSRIFQLLKPLEKMFVWLKESIKWTTRLGWDLAASSDVQIFNFCFQFWHPGGVYHW